MRKYSLQTIPPEVLQFTSTWLSTTDQATFAMCCRHLFLYIAGVDLSDENQQRALFILSETLKKTSQLNQFTWFQTIRYTTTTEFVIAVHTARELKTLDTFWNQRVQKIAMENTYVSDNKIKDAIQYISASTKIIGFFSGVFLIGNNLAPTQSIKMTCYLVVGSYAVLAAHNNIVAELPYIMRTKPSYLSQKKLDDIEHTKQSLLAILNNLLELTKPSVPEHKPCYA